MNDRPRGGGGRERSGGGRAVIRAAVAFDTAMYVAAACVWPQCGVVVMLMRL